MLETLLAKGKYAGIGEFYAFGDYIELPVLQVVVRLAKQCGVFLHAHSGFDNPSAIRGMLEKYPNLWFDLAYRRDHHSGGTVDAEWLKLFEAFPNRFMLGTDTFPPEPWFYVEERAEENRTWLSKMGPALAERVARQNALDVLGRTSFRTHD